MKSDVASPSELKARARREMRASGQAGGWTIDIVVPHAEPHAHLRGITRRLYHEFCEKDRNASLSESWKTKTILPEWFVAARRSNRGRPSDANVDFLRRFVVKLGAPDGIEPIGAFFFMWKGDP
jgi:hypothetical protein